VYFDPARLCYRVAGRQVVPATLIGLLLSALVPVASGFPSFEPFTDATASGETAYTAGSGLYHQTNALGESWSLWNGGSGDLAEQVMCVNSNLAYAGFPAGFPAPPASLAVSLPGTAAGVSGYSAALQLSQAVAADPNNLATNKVYASFLLAVPSLGNLTSSSPIYFGGFATNAGDQSVSLPSRAMKFFLKGNSATSGSSTSYAIGIQNASAAGTSAAYDAGGHTTASVLFVVVDYEFGINGAPDVANLWVNPPPASFGTAAPPTPTATFSTSTAAAQLVTAADFFLLARSGSTLWGLLLVGDLRVGDSWGYATGAPEIVTPPAGSTDAVGTAATFVVGAVAGATNVSPLGYQWQFNGGNLADGGRIWGSSSAMLTITNLLLTDAGTYTVIVSNSLTAVTSSVALKVIGAYLNPQIDYLSVRDFGAKGDGLADDTASILRAIAAAQSQGHNGVYVPPGKYVLTGTLTVSQLEFIGRMAGGWPAQNLSLPTLLIRHYNEPGLILQNGASVQGLALDYDTKTPTTTNAPAISLQGNGLSLTSLRIQNPYDGISTLASATPGRARFSDILILQPAHWGLQISKCYDFVQFHGVEVVCSAVMSTGAAFRFGRVDEGSYTGLSASNCATGLEFYADTDAGGGNFTGGFAGCSAFACGSGVTITGDHKVRFCGGSFAGLNSGAVINGTNAQVTLMGDSWQAGTGQAIKITQAANVVIEACVFSRPRALAAPLVWVANCTTVTLNGSQFLPGSTGVELDSQVQRALVTGNSFEDGGITNLMTSSKTVFAGNLIAASPPSGLAAIAGIGQVSLSWSPSVLATNYNLKRSLVSGGSYATIASTAGTAYTNTGLADGTTYYYVVSAVLGGVETSNSSEVSATPNAPPVLGVGLAPGGGLLTVSWPGWANDYALYAATNLSGPIAWQPLTNAPQSNSGMFFLNLPTTNLARQFFRLGPP
jgi:Pectate lyase superfamily protein/Right handed beta helix region